MVRIGEIIWLGIMSAVMVLSASAVGYTQVKESSTFEEALERQEWLRERYEQGSAEEQQRLRDRWQAVKERRESLSDEERALAEEAARKRQAEFELLSEAEKKARRDEMMKRWLTPAEDSNGSDE